jgi:hypothetical protein
MIMSIIIVAVAVSLGVGLQGDAVEVYAETYDVWEKAINKYVGKNRKEEAKGIFKASKKSLKEQQKEANHVVIEYFEVDQRYDATLEEYYAALAAFEEVWTRADKNIVDDRYKLKELLTDKEWEECIKYTQKKTSKTYKKVKKAVKKAEKDRAKQLKKIEKAEKKEKKKKK